MRDKFSPLVMAITNGHYDLAKYLLDHGADPNLATLSGLAALYATVDVQWAPHAWFPQPNIEQEKTSYLDLMKALIAHKARCERTHQREAVVPQLHERLHLGGSGRRNAVLARCAIQRCPPQ